MSSPHIAVNISFSSPSSCTGASGLGHTLLSIQSILLSSVINKREILIAKVAKTGKKIRETIVPSFNFPSINDSSCLNSNTYARIKIGEKAMTHRRNTTLISNAVANAIKGMIKANPTTTFITISIEASFKFHTFAISARLLI